MQRHDGVAGVVLATELALQLQLVEDGLHLIEFRPALRLGRLGPLGGQFGEYFGIFKPFELLAPCGDGLEKL
jgi:hypothetical protein